MTENWNSSTTGAGAALHPGARAPAREGVAGDHRARAPRALVPDDDRGGPGRGRAAEASCSRATSSRRSTGRWSRSSRSRRWRSAGGPTPCAWSSRPIDEGTELTLLDTLEERGKAARDGAGWHTCLDALERSLGGDAAARDEMDGWRGRSRALRRELRARGGHDRPARGDLAIERDGPARVRGLVERLDRTRLADRVVAAEQRRGLAADRRATCSRPRAGRSRPPRPRSARRRRRGAARSPARGSATDRRGTACPRRRRPRARRGVASASPASKCASTSSAKRIVAGEHDVDAVAADHLLGAHALGLAGDQPRAADAVAADVHQRAAVERRATAGRSAGSSAAKLNAARISRTPPDRAVARPARRARRVCGLWRYMNASISSRPSRSATSKARSHVGRAAAQRLLAQHVLAGLERADASTRRAASWAARCRRPRSRGRRAAPRSRRRRASIPLLARRSARARARSRLATARISTSGDWRAPARNWRLICAVEMMPHSHGDMPRHTTANLPDRVTAFAPRSRQPDRRAHRLQRRARAAVRDQRGRDGARRARSTEPRIEAIARRPRRARQFALAARSRPSGWRAFVRGAVAELRARRRAGCAARGSRSPATCRAAPGCPPRPRSRSRWRSRCSRWPTRPSPTGSSWRKLCSRVENDWVGAQTGLLDQLASLFGERRPRAADRLPLARGRGRCRSSSATTGSSRSTPASSTRTPARATTSAAPSARAACRAARRRRACATRRSRRPRRCRRRSTRRAAHVITENERVRRGRGGARARRPRRARARCSTPRTPACATTTRCRRPRSRTAVGAVQARPGRSARGSSAAASAATCSALLPPGAGRPDGAVEVAARGAGARMGRGWSCVGRADSRGSERRRRGRGRALATPGGAGGEARAAMERSAAVVAALRRAEEPAYGISTGFGSLALVRIPADARVDAPARADPLARGRDGPADRARGGAGDDAAAGAVAGDGLVGRAARGGRGDRSRC